MIQSCGASSLLQLVCGLQLWQLLAALGVHSWRRSKRRQYAVDVTDLFHTKVFRTHLRGWAPCPPRRATRAQFLAAYSDGEGSGQVAVRSTFLDRASHRFLLCDRACRQNIHRIEAVSASICLLT